MNDRKLGRHLTVVIVSLGASGPASVLAGDQVIIKNLARGLVCGATAAERHICFETDTIQVTNESTCVFSGRRIPCTWYGFSFDYDLPAETVKLQCTWSSTEQVNDGDIKAEHQVGAKQGTYELELKSTDRHFFNAQYVSASTAREKLGQVTRTRQACSYQGTKLFELSFSLRHPER